MDSRIKYKVPFNEPSKLCRSYIYNVSCYCTNVCKKLRVTAIIRVLKNIGKFGTIEILPICAQPLFVIKSYSQSSASVSTLNLEVRIV
jgi:hypothetical protein